MTKEKAYEIIGETYKGSREPVLSGHTLKNFDKPVESIAWDTRHPNNIECCINDRVFSHSVRPTTLALSEIEKFSMQEAAKLDSYDFS